MLPSQSDLSSSDVEELSNIYAGEYNQAELHDRVLVLDVFRDEWEASRPSAANEERREIKTRNALRCETKDKKSNLDISSGQTKVLERKRNREDESTDRKKPKVMLPCDILQQETKDGAVDSVGIGKAEENLSSCSAGIGTESERVSIEDQLPSSTAVSVFTQSDSEMLTQHKIFVHSSWLSVHSSYFRSLFYRSGLSETRSYEVHLKIHESEEKAHLQVLQAIYRPDILNDASADELLIVLELADKYDVKFVFRKCKYVLKLKATSIGICEKIVHVVNVKHKMTDVDDLADAIGAFLSKEFSPLDETWRKENFKNLSENLLSYLLSSDDLTTQTENTVFHALMHWIESNYKFNDGESGKDLTESSLLSVVRFELMTMDYLFCVVQHHPIATKMLHFQEQYVKGVTYHALQEDVKKCLKVKPVKRKTPVNDVVQYRWILPTEVNSLPSETEITSGIFWSCGYKWQLTFLMLNNRSHNLTSRISLRAVGLIEESFLSLIWALKSEGKGRISNGFSNISLNCPKPHACIYTLDKNTTDDQPLYVDVIIELQ